MELAQKLHSGIKLPADVPQLARRAHVSDGPGASTFPNGCHVAEVEVDPETGVVEVVKYSCVNDFGTVINPMIVEGQLHGGVVQGIGQALMEQTVYDEEGQFLTGSFMDYAMPRADDVPQFSRRRSSGAGDDQSARRQRLRRSGLRRRADLGDERGGRRARRIRHPPYRHAGDARSASGRRSKRPRRARGLPHAMTQAIPSAAMPAAPRRG